MTPFAPGGTDRSPSKVASPTGILTLIVSFVFPIISPPFTVYSRFSFVCSVSTSLSLLHRQSVQNPHKTDRSHRKIQEYSSKRHAQLISSALRWWKVGLLELLQQWFWRLSCELKPRQLSSSSQWRCRHPQ